MLETVGLTTIYSQHYSATRTHALEFIGNQRRPPGRLSQSVQGSRPAVLLSGILSLASLDRSSGIEAEIGTASREAVVWDVMGLYVEGRDDGFGVLGSWLGRSSCRWYQWLLVEVVVRLCGNVI